MFGQSQSEPKVCIVCKPAALPKTQIYLANLSTENLWAVLQEKKSSVGAVSALRTTGQSYQKHCFVGLTRNVVLQGQSQH